MRRLGSTVARLVPALSMLLGACRAEDTTSAQPQLPAPMNTNADARHDEDDEPAQVKVELGLVDDAAREALAARLGPDSPVARAQALLAVHHHILDGWHIYWRNPGESGLRTRIEVEIEGGQARAGDVIYPAPDRFTADGGQITYGWGHEAALFVPLSGADLSMARIAVRSDYLACRESCIPGHAELSASFAQLAPSTSAATAQMLARVPEPAGGRVQASWSANTLRLSATAPVELAELFPYELDSIVLDEQRVGEAGALELHYRFTGPAPADQAQDQGQGVLRSTIDGETRYLDLAVPWPAS